MAVIITVISWLSSAQHLNKDVSTKKSCLNTISQASSVSRLFSSMQHHIMFTTELVFIHLQAVFVRDVFALASTLMGRNKANTTRRKKSGKPDKKNKQCRCVWSQTFTIVNVLDPCGFNFLRKKTNSRIVSQSFPRRTLSFLLSIVFFCHVGA